MPPDEAWTDNAEDRPDDFGGPERLCQLLFVAGDVLEALPAVRAYTDDVEADDLATVRLVSPFFRTVVGTDRYADQLW